MSVLSPKTRNIDFAIAGVQKAGTTVLAQYLGQHKNLFLSPDKELHAFKRWPDVLAVSERRIQDACQHARADQYCGDATPVYLYWPHALELMAQYNPNMKLIISLRHPVMRAYSGWSMETKRGRETLDFSTAIREGRARVKTAGKNVHLIYSYVERGFYAAQIKRALEIFPREQMFFLRADQINAGHQCLEGLLDFLAVSPMQFTPITHNVFPSSIRADDDSLRADFAYLQDLYESDMQQLQSLTGLDVSGWISAPPKTGDGNIPEKF